MQNYKLLKCDFEWGATYLGIEFKSFELMYSLGTEDYYTDSPQGKLIHNLAREDVHLKKKLSAKFLDMS